MIPDPRTPPDLIAPPGFDPSSDLAARLSNDPLASGRHDDVLRTIRAHLAGGRLRPAWFAELQAELPEHVVNPPLLNDPTPEANLCESLLLAAAALGQPLDGELEAVAVGARAPWATAPWRVGHILQRRAPEKSETRLLPVLAAMLAAGSRDDLRRRAGDLAWDALLQERAASADATNAELARLALASPARLLARRPEAVAYLGSNDPTCPADSTPTRLLAAAGVPVDPLPVVVAPGAAAVRINALPSIPEPIAVLREMLTAPTVWKRSEALLRLLTREPIGMIAGVELDLHREASAYIASALRPADELAPGSDRGIRPNDWIRLEVAALHHGAVLAKRALPDNDDHSRRVLAAWVLAEWIGRVLRESPFFGADPELLAARLESALPSSLPNDEDALWPATIGADSSSLRLDELWLLRTLIVARDRWMPPGAVLDGLRRLAGRILNAAERGAEAHLEEGRNALSWPGAHIAPPLAARWLLHLWGAEWLAKIHEDAQEETLRFLKTWIEQGRAARGVWVMLALYREAPQLISLTEQTKNLWTSAADQDDLERVLGDALAPFCLWGSTYLDTLEPRHIDILSRLAKQTPASWRVGVLMKIAGASSDARDALLDLIKPTSERALRLPAAVAAIQLGRRLPESERELFLNRVDAELGDDLRAHPSVRVELKNAGRTA